MNRENSFPREELHQLLTQLIQQILKRVEVALREGAIKLLSRSYMRFTAEGSLFRGETFQKPDWAAGGHDIWCDIQKLPLSDEVVGRLSRLCEVEDARARHWLSQFVMRTVEEALSQGKGPDALVDNIVLFLDEIEEPERSYEFNIRVYVEGLSLEGTEIQLDDDTILRNAHSQTYEVEVGPYGWDPQSSFFPSAFLDIKAASPTPPGVSGNKVEGTVETGVAALRLFKVGVVHYTRYDWHTKAIIGPPRGSIMPHLSYVENPSYVIRKQDEDRLTDFWLEVKKRLPKEVERYWIAERASFLTLAFQRYSDALLRDGVIERRIATGVMGLEALYLSGGAEASYKLRVRAAKVLSFLGYDSIKVIENLKEGYNVRSAFVHGRLSKEDDRRNLAKLMTHVLEYLRASILVILLGGCKDKSDMIELADNALIHEDANNELKSRLEKVVSLVRVPEERLP